jgi:hypothetical protein
VATLVVGGHARNVGKTAVIASLIAATPELTWTAIKISQHAHTDGVILTLSNEKGKAPRISPIVSQPFRICREHDTRAGTDSSRYLAAGAVRSLFVHGSKGSLNAAMPRIQEEIESSDNSIIESNHILRFLRPDLYLLVLDSQIADFKPSALLYLHQCDAVVLTNTASSHPAWPESAREMIRSKPAFHAAPPNFSSPKLVTFVSRELTGVRDIP